MTVCENLTIEEKLEILSDAAKYDVACTSSGVDRKGKAGSMGNAASCGICHAFAADGRCISLLKVLYSNECVYDCKYCINRASNDTVRTSFTPDELCELTMQFYRRNYIEGLFLSSGVRNNPTETMEQMYIAVRKLREECHFNGYIHIKAVPGAAPEIIAAIGLLADRMSTNLELPTSESLKALAPNKTRTTILKPMRQIQIGIADSQVNGATSMQRLVGNAGDKYLLDLKQIRKEQTELGTERSLIADINMVDESYNALMRREQYSLIDPSKLERKFVPAGQSTQMIIGATPENDYQIVSVAESLYKKFDLKRVFYSAYIALNDDSALPAIGTKPPLLREHRLYQADFLLRFYGFEAKELLSEERPNFNVFFDPKCEWAIRHLELFPMEINRVSYDMLLRIPGIGVKSAKRIVRARRHAKLDFDALKRIGVVLKRAHYFITCSGKMLYQTKIDEDYITRHIVSLDQKKNWQIQFGDMTYKQLSLFDDMNLPMAIGN